MAVAGAQITNGSGASLDTYTTASYTPTANALQLVAVWAHNPGGTPTPPTSLTGHGLTYVKVNDFGVQFGRNLSVWRALGASPSNGALSINFSAGAADLCRWAVAEFTGVSTSGTNGSGAVVQNVTNFVSGSDTQITVTLAAFASASNATYGAFLTQENPTAGSGFTQLIEFQVGGSGDWYSTEWRADNDTTVNVTWGASASNTGGFAIEIAAGPQTVSITPATETDSAQALTFTKTIFKTATPATETDAAQALTFTKTIVKTVTPATETDAAQVLSVTHAILVSLTPALETDAAQALVFAIVRRGVLIAVSVSVPRKVTATARQPRKAAATARQPRKVTATAAQPRALVSAT